MRNSSPPPHPPPSSAPTPSPSRKRLLTSPKPKQGPPASNFLPQNDKKTRDLPNLSDCHGCGIRINYGNPKERLQPLNSIWRIVLLCKKCIKQVSSGETCPYCFEDTGNFVSDCFKCSDCERSIHKDCIVRYGNSTPWSYCCKELGLGFSVCIDCLVPELLRNSIKVSRKNKSSVTVSGELCATKGDSRGLQKDTGVCRSLQEVAEDANSVMQKNVAVAVKAKEKALRKAMVAKNAVELASSVLDLVAKKDCNGKNSVLDRSKGNGIRVSNVTRVVDDAELAFRLHRTINSSPRISKNVCSVNLSYSDLLKTMDSNSINLGGGEGGKLRRCSNMKLNGNHDSNILEPSACIRAKGGGLLVDSGRFGPELKTYKRKNQKIKCSNMKANGDHDSNILEPSACIRAKGGGLLVDSGRFIPELKTYKRKNRKRRECLENGDFDSVSTSIGVIQLCTTSDDSRLAYISHSCWQGELKQELYVNDSRTSTPERCKTNFVAQERSTNAMPNRYMLKYGKRITGSRRESPKEVKPIHEETNSSCVSFEKEARASAPGLPMVIGRYKI